MESTQELEHRIRKSSAPDVLEKDAFAAPSLTEYLATVLRDHSMTVQDVILRCNLDRSYGYQMFNGTRTPTRNFLLRLSLLLGLSETETQRLLKIAGRPPLYARKRRDAAVLYGLIHGLTVEETDALLHSLNEEGLA